MLNELYSCRSYSRYISCDLPYYANDRTNQERHLMAIQVGAVGFLLTLIGWWQNWSTFIVIGLLLLCGALLWSRETEDSGTEEPRDEDR